MKGKERTGSEGKRKSYSKIKSKRRSKKIERERKR